MLLVPSVVPGKNVQVRRVMFLQLREKRHQPLVAVTESSSKPDRLLVVDMISKTTFADTHL